MLVYKATNRATGMSYVGQTILPLRQRKINHMKTVRQGSSSYFHNALRKNGVDGFEWEIVCEICNNSRDTLDAFEMYYIEKFNSLWPNGYNLTTGGGTCVFTEKTKKKMSESRKAHTMSEDHKKAISEALMGRDPTNLGVPHTEEHKTKISESMIGKKNHFYGKTHTDETKAKIAEANRNRSPVSEETHKKMSEATKLQWEKRSPHNRRASVEARRKMSESAKLRWKNKRLKDQKGE